MAKQITEIVRGKDGAITHYIVDGIIMSKEDCVDEVNREISYETYAFPGLKADIHPFNYEGNKSLRSTGDGNTGNNIGSLPARKFPSAGSIFRAFD